jgi:hypothetical protein
VLLALGTLALLAALRDGEGHFFATSDPQFFRLVARAPFGAGDLFAAAGQPEEAAYRYGRIGLPLVAWLMAAARPAWVGWSLVTLNIVAIAAIPYLAARYLRVLGRDPRYAAFVLAVPGLLVLYDRPYAEPLAIAAVLAGLVADARGRQGRAIVWLALAVLTRETALVAIVAFAAHGALRRDRRAARWVAAAAPYALWVTWVKIRVGEWPFLADAPSRSEALGLPFAGVRDAFARGGDARTAAVIALVTVAALAATGWVTRHTALGCTAFLAAPLVACAGPNSLAYLGETLRIFAFAHMLVVTTLAVVVSHALAPARAP